MKPKTKPPTSRRKVTVPTMQTFMNGLRRPFTPTPVQHDPLRRFGPARPTKPGTQI
jgi:hypothetical protein